MNANSEQIVACFAKNSVYRECSVCTETSLVWVFY